jgi:hypothetical protein
LAESAEDNWNVARNERVSIEREAPASKKLFGEQVYVIASSGKLINEVLILGFESTVPLLLDKDSSDHITNIVYPVCASSTIRLFGTVSCLTSGMPSGLNETLPGRPA